VRNENLLKLEKEEDHPRQGIESEDYVRVQETQEGTKPAGKVKRIQTYPKEEESPDQKMAHIESLEESESAGSGGEEEKQDNDQVIPETPKSKSQLNEQEEPFEKVEDKEEFEELNWGMDLDEEALEQIDKQKEEMKSETKEVNHLDSEISKLGSNKPEKIEESIVQSQQEAKKDAESRESIVEGEKLERKEESTELKEEMTEDLDFLGDDFEIDDFDEDLLEPNTIQILEKDEIKTEEVNLETKIPNIQMNNQRSNQNHNLSQKETKSQPLFHSILILKRRFKIRRQRANQ